MHPIKTAAATFALAATLYACGGRGPQTPVADAGTTNPCVGACVDAGSNTDGGNNQNDGGNNDAGFGQLTLNVAQLRSGAAQYGQPVKLVDVVVTQVYNKFQGGAGDWLGDFWVADPEDPTSGIWVEKYFTDTPKPYEPKIGDVLTIEGYYGNNSGFEDRVGFRQVVKSQFDFVKSGAKPLAITVGSEGGDPLDDVEAPISFGDAQNGNARPNPEFGGARVFIPGPLKIIDPNPTPLERYEFSVLKGSNGFELTGGILVNNFTTNTQPACDWRRIALDAGRFDQEVVFPNGVTGAWDTYTHASCIDAGSDLSNPAKNCFRARGTIPGSSFDGGTDPNNWTFVLYPQTCADLPGVVQDIQ